jgi:hypothetical protein
MATVSLSLGANAEEPLTWQRTWYNSVTLQWQPQTASETRQYYPIDQWAPLSTIKLHHSNAFTFGGKLYAGNNPFYQYDMNGNFERQFSITGVSDVWKATTDGTYVYMLEWEKNGIFVVDMAQQKVVSIISTPPGFLYYLKYLPSLDDGNGGFLTGNYSSVFFINKSGDRIGNSLDLTPIFGDTCVAQDVAVVGDKLYVLGNDNTRSRNVHEFELDDLEATGNTFDLYEHVGEGGVEEAYYPRTLITYTYPDNKENLMFVDYSGMDWDATSILVSSVPLTEGLEGYNLYRDGTKLNSSLISPDTCMFVDNDAQQGVDMEYEVKPVVNGTEGEVAFNATVNLSDTRILPYEEDFSESYPYGYTSNKLTDSYSYVDGVDSLQAWTVGNGIIQYHHGYDTLFHQTLVTRPLHATAGDSVRVAFSYAGNTYLSGLDLEEMNVEVSIDGGTSWENYGSVTYHAQYNVYTPVEFDITEYVAGKDFMVRLCPTGESHQSYNWQIDDLKVYEFSHQTFNGRVLLAGSSIGHQIEVTAVEKVTGQSYSALADADGNFNIADMNTGDYEFTFADSAHTATAEAQFGGSAEVQLFDLAGARFTSSQSALNVELAENVTKPYTIGFDNIGNATAALHLSFEPKNAEVSTSGNSDLDVEDAWEENKMFVSTARANSGIFYFNGKFYQRSASYSSVELNEMDAKGNTERTITLTFDDDYSGSPSGFFVMNGELYVYTNPQSWSTPAVPAYYMPVDLNESKILSSRKDSLNDTITSLNGLGYNPQDSSLYVISGYSLYKLNSDNDLAETYTLPEWGYNTLAFDTYTEGGPYVWMSKSSYSPVGFTLGKYSLKSQTFVSTFNVNDLASSQFNSLPSYSASPGTSSLQASSDICPGYFSLVFSQGWSTRTGNFGTQLYVFRMFPVETWLMLTGNGKSVDAQSQSDFVAIFNTTGLQSGDVKQADVILSSDNLADNVVIPVTLTVDGSLNSRYPNISGLTAEVTDDYQGQLSWDAMPDDVSVDHFEVFRNGDDLAGVTENLYTDERPLYGTQQYYVETHFSDSVTMVSDTVSLNVENPEWGLGVNDLRAELVGDSSVRLTWNKEIEYQDAFFDDFESYEPFIINGIGDWTLYDLDNSYTYGNTQIDYTNENSKMAGIIFDPEKTTPADETFLDEYGNQMFAFTSSNVQELDNNDWLVSPELNLSRPSVVSFKLRTRNAGYGTEKLAVMYSTTDNAPESFINAADTISTTSSSWLNYEVDIPKEARYVAFNYVSRNTYQLFVDDVYIGEKGQFSRPTGYNVYRDETLLTNTPQSDTTYLDSGLTIGDYLYTVETLYENGGKGRSQVQIAITGIGKVSVSPVLSEQDGMLTFSQGFDRMRCYNASGTMVKQLGRCEGPARIDTAGYPHGVYIFVIELSGKTYKYKLAL